MNDFLVKQVVGLAWIRCCMEEGVNFIDNETGEPEEDERAIFESFEARDGRFNLPSANCSVQGMEKNLYEVIGSYVVNIKDAELRRHLFSLEFAEAMRGKVEEIRSRRGKSK